MKAPNRIRIKICGVSSVETAAAAVDAGADAIGLMFYAPSHRHLEMDQAAKIRGSLPPFISSIAVMVNPEPEYVREIIQRTGVDGLQFHGEETDEFCSAFNLPYLKAIRVADGTDLRERERDYPRCQGILLDAFVADRYGGSGERFDWGLADYGGIKPLILAGGLHAENVADAIEQVAPFGVDVSSGVETDGVKDSAKIHAFCRSVFQNRFN